MRAYLTLRQVANKLGKRAQWMYRNIKKLQTQHGFPLRDDAMGGFDEHAVTAWQDSRAGFTTTVTSSIPLPSPEDLSAWADELDRRAGALN